jgi:hypothetical protein
VSRRAGAWGAACVAVLLLAAPPLARANGGIARLVREPVGGRFVTVYSSPTPLRTGELDISVMVQDSSDARLDLDVRVVATLIAAAEDADPVAARLDEIRLDATRDQATNKLFKAAKFDVDVPGEWAFRVEIETVGSVEFTAPVVRSTILDRPYLLAALVLLPLALIGWLVTGRDEEDEPAAG